LNPTAAGAAAVSINARRFLGRNGHPIGWIEAAKHEPDSFYVNHNIKLIADDPKL
jgi:hypothetical protein